jgi:chorismate mutase
VQWHPEGYGRCVDIPTRRHLGSASSRFVAGSPKVHPAEPEPLKTEGGDVVPVRAVRGATQVDANDRDVIVAGAAELVRAVLDRNRIDPGDLISVVFTATPDLTAEFPAYAARAMGITDVPLLCATEIDVPGAMPRVIRLLAHVETSLPREDLRHVYLHGAAALRTDLPR